MATLNLVDTFSIETRGRTYSGKQGEADDSADDPLALTVEGDVYETNVPLATATVIKVWDKDVNFPGTFEVMYFWSDEEMVIQLVGATSEVKHIIRPFMPFKLGGSTFLASASTTD